MLLLAHEKRTNVCFLSIAHHLRDGNTLKVEYEDKCVSTYWLLNARNDPPSTRRILAKSTAFRNGTSTSSSKCNSTANLYFFFFIMNAIPGAPGPISVIHNKFVVLRARWKANSTNSVLLSSRSLGITASVPMRCTMCSTSIAVAYCRPLYRLLFHVVLR